MLSSIDGRIQTDKWPPFKGIEHYERTGKLENADAWMCGRTTMQQHYAVTYPELSDRLSDGPKEDHIAAVAGTYAVVLDPRGKLGWDTNDLDGDHLITVLTRMVSYDYLMYLQEKGISYIIGGDEAIDLNVVLSKLQLHFNIQKIMLEGGGGINGSFHLAGLIDEYSILYYPVADGSTGPTVLDTRLADTGSVPFRQLKLTEVTRLDNDIIWTRYRVQKEH
jgi:2,5-diamino-6-(ribosylamino)-4(3H)-pyrimidinone 5'-phosphate reductase